MSGREDGIRRSRLGSGLRVVTESLPALRSASVGFWVGTGARDERDGSAGASHFLEHLLFKGTDTRSALDIAQSVESVGGDMNAFTTHECTSYYVRVPEAHLPRALDLLNDVVWRPALRAEELEAERGVILEEIGMRDDAPDEVLHELVSASLFPAHPLGRPVLGDRGSLRSIGRDEVAAYHGSHYRAGNVVVAAAGNLDHDEVLAAVAAPAQRASGDRPAREVDPLVPAVPVALLSRPTEQAHVAIASRALTYDDPDRHALTVVNQVLGGGMASRLFQEVRERRGLAYSVFSYRGAYSDAGALVAYAGTTPARARAVLEVLATELEAIAGERPVTRAELEAAKGHLVGSTALALETSASRMHRLGRSELTLGEVPTIDELVAALEAVTLDDVARVVERVLVDSERAVAVVGPFADGDFSDAPGARAPARR